MDEHISELNDIELQRLERCKRCSMSVITDDFLGLGIMELVCPLYGFECREVVQCVYVPDNKRGV